MHMASNSGLSQNRMRVLIIAVAILLVLVVVGVCVLRFGFPDKWDALINALFSSELADGQLVVHFIDVGQGDGIYIEFPDGKDMLIDMGSTEGMKDAAAVNILKDLNDDNIIDHLMLTHTDQDHVEFLDAVLGAFDVANIYMPNVKAEPSNKTLLEEVNNLDKDKLALFTDPDVVTSSTYAKFFIAALSEEDCSIRLNMDKNANSNDIVISGEGYNLTFWCPTAQFYADNNLKTAERLNAVSPVGILTFNSRRIVFTGDSNSLNEPLIAERIGYLDCDVLKVAHHGSQTSSVDEFLRAVNCEYAVISCGADNSYDHPRQATLNRLKALGMTVYRTDLNGDVTLTVNDKGELLFSTQRTASQKDIFTGQDVK